MATYGWAILIIVIVAAVLYSFGIFNPSSSASATITGFSGLGVTQAACVNSVNNQILELYVSNSIGYPVNVTKINVTGSNGIVTSQNVSSILSSGQSGIFYVNGACNKSSSTYSGSAIITYTEPGQTFSGPYFSIGKVASVSVTNNPILVASFNGVNSGINANSLLLPNSSRSRTIVAWFETKYQPSSAQSGIFGYGTQACTGQFFWAFLYDCGGGGIQIDGWCTCQTVVSPPITLEKWYFIAFEYNGTYQIGYSGQLGSTLSSVNSRYNFNTNTASNSVFYIGDIINRQDWNGSIANIQAYNTALTQQQISTIYDMGVGGAPLSNAGLVGWWPLDGNANDYSGNNNNGVATNVNWVSP